MARDLTGQRFGRLTVLGLDTSTQSSKTVARRWLCGCDCGAARSIPQGHLTGRGGQQSCGCLQYNSALDLTGQQFGRLTVIGLDPGPKQRRRYWTCRCECGTTKDIRQAHLTAGKILSCGCWRREQTVQRNTTHGQSRRRQWSHEYMVYASMKQRCVDPNQRHYRHYGGRGISVCFEWLTSFERFLTDVGPCPPGMSLDRIDVNGNYEPGNVRWASDKTQARNKRTTRILIVDGVRMSLADAVECLGVNQTSIMKAVRGSVLGRENRKKLRGHSVLMDSQATE